jgi:biopolymer transport protein ExbB/TolQ
MNFISNILYWISTGLMVPVIVLLILFFVRALLLIGGFFGQYLSVKRTQGRLSAPVAALSADTIEDFETSMASVKGGAVVRYIHEILEHRGDKARVDYLVSQYEVEADQQLALSKTLTKMGPILGLMGTLIPMGPALVGLSSGDIASMAYNMQVAFATTVVGMVISAIGFVTQQAKERWFVRDLSTLEFVAETVTSKR